jgi:hypothetical protein
MAFVSIIRSRGVMVVADVVDWREGRRKGVREVTLLSLSLTVPLSSLLFLLFSTSLTSLTLALQNANHFLFMDEEGSLGGLCSI